MPVKVQLENGRIIEFENEPTGEDIDFVIEQMGGIKPSFISPPMLRMKQIMEERPDIKKAAIIMTRLAKSPIGRLSLRLAGKKPEEIERVLTEFEPEAITKGEKFAKGATDVASSFIAAAPIIRGVSALPLINKMWPTLKLATGLGVYSGAKEAIEGKPQMIIPATAGGAATGLVTGGLMKGGATIVPKQIPGAERIGSALGGAAAGKILGGTTEDAALMGALGAIFPSKRAEFKKIGISKIRDYAGNKVTKIRKGAKDYWKKEVNAYGKSIEQLTTDEQPVDLNPLMERMTKLMIERNLYDPVNEKWLTPVNKVDGQLYKSYEALSRLFVKQGNAPAGEIIKEWRNIRDSASIDTPLGREAKFLANNMLDSISPQIKSDVFKNANIRYTKFRNNFDLIDKRINVWGRPLETGKGEKFLVGGELGRTKEARETARLIERELGQKLTRAKIESAIRRFPFLKWILR